MRAVLFAADPARLAVFYAEALGMTRAGGDDWHVALRRDGFELVVHRAGQASARDERDDRPPVRRAEAAIRLDFTVPDVDRSRVVARALGGDIDEAPPPWADPAATFRLGVDPEGNVFGVG